MHLLRHGLACLAGGRPGVTTLNLFITVIAVSKSYNWNSLYNKDNVLPYMEQIKLLTALHRRTRNNPIMSTVIMLQVSTAAVLYKQCNLTVVWGKKKIYICIYKKGNGLTKVSDDIIQVGLYNSFYGQ